jgi:hypothetical protein
VTVLKTLSYPPAVSGWDCIWAIDVLPSKNEVKDWSLIEKRSSLIIQKVDHNLQGVAEVKPLKRTQSIELFFLLEK